MRQLVSIANICSFDYWWAEFVCVRVILEWSEIYICGERGREKKRKDRKWEKQSFGFYFLYIIMVCVLCQVKSVEPNQNKRFRFVVADIFFPAELRFSLIFFSKFKNSIDVSAVYFLLLFSNTFDSRQLQLWLPSIFLWFQYGIFSDSICFSLRQKFHEFKKKMQWQW